jgi:hypothetical protein
VDLLGSGSSGGRQQCTVYTEEEEAFKRTNANVDLEPRQQHQQQQQQQQQQEQLVRESSLSRKREGRKL